MLLKRFPPCISLEEVKDGWIFTISSETIVYYPLFELRESGCLGIDGFESISMLRVCVDLLTEGLIKNTHI
jgi:hypothetical protein